MVPISGIQGVKKKADNSFSQREEDDPPYYNFSDEKFMFKRTWQVVFWGTRNYFRHPKQLAARLKAREGFPPKSEIHDGRSVTEKPNAYGRKQKKKKNRKYGQKAKTDPAVYRYGIKLTRKRTEILSCCLKNPE